MNELVSFAKKQIGTFEWKDGINPKIKEMFGAVGHDEVKDDATAWCAAFTGYCLKSCGFDFLKTLTARSYLNYGTPVKHADMQPGDLLIWKRGNSSWQGHVEILVAKRGAFVDVIGGNVANQVKSYSRKIDPTLLGIRRPVKMTTIKEVSRPNIKPKVVTKPVSKKPSIIALIVAAIAAGFATYFGVGK